MTIALEEIQENENAEGLDQDEVGKILCRLGPKCLNREYVETILSANPLPILPGLMKGYCRFCIGYKDLGECGGKGYGNDRMRIIETIRDI